MAPSTFAPLTVPSTMELPLVTLAINPSSLLHTAFIFDPDAIVEFLTSEFWIFSISPLLPVVNATKFAPQLLNYKVKLLSKQLVTVILLTSEYPTNPPPQLPPENVILDAFTYTKVIFALQHTPTIPTLDEPEQVKFVMKTTLKEVLAPVYPPITPPYQLLTVTVPFVTFTLVRTWAEHQPDKAPIFEKPVNLKYSTITDSYVWRPPRPRPTHAPMQD
ncbi:Hypothetical_protein [Hexamita inflata]|uniref:Hypothetical_protein n=1 Tax=Hexamita inflata TaxID=28002 RepID=A0ABP1GWP5_9EUKA